MNSALTNLNLPLPNLSPYSRPSKATTIKTALFRKNSNLFSLNPTPYLLTAELPEKVKGFADYSQLAFNTLKSEVTEFCLKHKMPEEIVARLNGIEISLKALQDFEFRGQVSIELMDFYVNYLMKLQVLEEKSILFLKTLTESSQKHQQIPKKNLFKYLIFVLRSGTPEKWMMILFEPKFDNCDVFYAFEELTKPEMVKIAKKTLSLFGLQSSSLIINSSFPTEPRNDSGLKILSLVLQIYLTNENFENIKSQPFKKSELLYALYNLIALQNGVALRKTRAQVSAFNLSSHDEPSSPLFKKKKKPDLKLIISNKIMDQKAKHRGYENSPLNSPNGKSARYFVKPGFQKQPSGQDTARTVKSRLKSPVRLPPLSKQHTSELQPQKIQISKNELKSMLKDMKASIFEEIERKDLVHKFVSKEFKGQDDRLELSTNDLKRMLKNFKKDFSENLETEKRRKVEEYWEKQMKMGEFQNMMSYFYYYNPEIYQDLSMHVSKRLGDYYLGSLFN